MAVRSNGQQVPYCVTTAFISLLMKAVVDTFNVDAPPPRP
jgi:hypothetical protein